MKAAWGGNKASTAVGATCALKHHHQSTSPQPLLTKGRGSRGALSLRACSTAGGRVAVQAGNQLAHGPASNLAWRHAPNSMHARWFLGSHLCMAMARILPGSRWHLQGVGSRGGGRRCNTVSHTD